MEGNIFTACRDKDMAIFGGHVLDRTYMPTHNLMEEIWYVNHVLYIYNVYICLHGTLDTNDFHLYAFFHRTLVNVLL